MKVVEGPLGAPIAHCFGLKHVENGDKIYHHIAIASVWHLFWESGTNFRRIEAVPIYDSASVALYIHASCSCPTRCTHVLLGFKGVKWGSKLCPYRHRQYLRHLLWGPSSGIFDVVGGNQGCSNVRPCELFMTY